MVGFMEFVAEFWAIGIRVDFEYLPECKVLQAIFLFYPII